MKKNAIFVGLLFFFLCPLVTNAYNNYHGHSDDYYEDAGGNYSSCVWEYCYSDEDDTVSKVTITGDDDLQEGKGQWDICSSTSNRDDCWKVDGLPNPLNDDGSTNPAYHEFLNEWRNDAIVDGKLNPDNEYAQMLAEYYCGTGVTDSCSEKIANIVAERKANGEDDGIDANVNPCLEIFERATGDKTMACAGPGVDYCDGSTDYPGVDGVFQNGNESPLCAMQSACKAGSDNTYTDVSAGDLGTCVWDSIADKFPDMNCGEQCAYACKQAASGSSTCYDDCYKARCDPEDEPDPVPPEYPEPDKCPLAECGKACEATPVLPKNKEQGGTCGVSYSGTFYEWGSTIDSCGTTNYVIETNVNISVPSALNKEIKAGKGFSWGGFSGTATIKQYAGDTAKLTAKYAELAIKQQNLSTQYGCDVAEINEARGTAHTEATCSQCNTDCSGYEDPAEAATCGQGIGDCKTKCHDDIDDHYDSLIAARTAAYNADLAALAAEVSVLDGCKAQIAQAPKTTKTINNIMTSSSPTLRVNDFTQIGNSVVAINKNNGFPITEFSEGYIKQNSFVNEWTFFIPTYFEGGKGNLSQTGTSQYKTLNVICPITIINDYYEEDDGKINVIYRPISLTNPFPNTTSSAPLRETLGFWFDETIDRLILNNRGVADYNIYNLTPMYTITLTPSDIKDIRKYNDLNDYNDFNMQCTDGLYCRSNFLWSNYNHLIDSGNSCAMSNDWYACDDDFYAESRDALLYDLKTGGKR